MTVIKTAAVQLSPVLYSREDTVDKVVIRNGLFAVLLLLVLNLLVVRHVPRVGHDFPYPGYRSGQEHQGKEYGVDDSLHVNAKPVLGRLAAPGPMRSSRFKHGPIAARLRLPLQRRR